MSHNTYNIDEECESKLSLVIRKPQEGKTYICITNITNDRSKNIHIVLTMNTLASGMQFFGRMGETIGPKNIIVFNSKKKTASIGKDNDSNCHHAKDVSAIFTLIRNYPNIKVIVCCAHEKRIRESIPQLFIQAADMISFIEKKRKLIVHIDEAHKYIPENQDYIREFNISPIVKSIIGYSGSPNGIWSAQKEDLLFHKILIRDIEEELQIIRSPEYFGINSCEHIIIENEIPPETIVDISSITPEIPTFAWINADMPENKCPFWYGEHFYFDLGNEMLFLKYIHYILPRMEIPQEQFSYNFIPAYTRKVTHYQTVEIIHSIFPKANVIVMNGNGTVLFRLRRSLINPDTKVSKKIKTDKIIKQNASPEENKLLLEPSYLIQKLIEDHMNCPTFVTGYTCVGMSVTLINQNMGNFDNVVMAHQHFSSDKLYQLCRFLFNYTSWSQENKDRIKKTKIYSLTKSVMDTCIKYEEDVEHMITEFSGKKCSLREIQGLEPEEPSERERKTKALLSIILKNENDLWKKFKVYDGNDDEQWTKVATFYKSVTDKNISTKSMPKKHMPKKSHEMTAFYHCSTTGNVAIQTDNTIKRMTSQSWWSTFQLLPGQLNYARIFVGYESLEDSSEYTIYVKYARLPDTTETRDILSRYGKKTLTTPSSDDDENEDILV
jgi:hypothetical protein